MNNNQYQYLLTPAGEHFTFEKPLAEYPRPQLQRDSYCCLNGKWEYAILPTADPKFHSTGNIIVPYPVESRLSGVMLSLKPNDFLHYRLIFDKPADFTKAQTILHFGAVDQRCQVYLNQKLLGEHVGGYWPFNFIIGTELRSHSNELVVIVQDASNTQSELGFGKQAQKRGGIWYTPCSGIWQTVWLENVSANYVSALTLTPILDENCLNVELHCSQEARGNIKIYDENGIICESNFSASNFKLQLNKVTYWTPDNPHLYQVEIALEDDLIHSYFGMRKWGIGTSVYGPCFTLNNQPFFMNGLLDQGYYSDGIYTPASYQEMKNDLLLTKKAGYNTLRKHIKIEPLIWYYYCDQLGIIVWQDMINSGTYSFWNDTALPTIGFRKKRDDQLPFNRTFEQEMRATYDHLKGITSIALWTIFNEGWGQHQTKYYLELLSSWEKTRLIDHASGWFDQNCGLIDSRHVYFKPVRFKRRDLSRVLSLSEFGGYSYKINEHSFNLTKTYGYRYFLEQPLFEDALIELYEHEIISNIKNGLSAAIYTQLSDVEDETNGLITYDRKIVKCDLDRLKAVLDKCKF